MTVDIRVGDALSVLRDMPDESVHCAISSPPYWGLRAYKGDPGMIGLEPTFDEHLENLVAVFREVRRVLRKDGTLWLNYGDAYAASGGRWESDPKPCKQASNHGSTAKKRGFTVDWYKPKDLMLMPARVAMALQADGWWLRSEIVWHKCLSGGAWLYAETQKGVGPHMLRDLVRLDPSTVRLWNGERWTRVVAWSESPAPRVDPVEIVLRSGERIGCTQDHRWPTHRGLLEARDLRKGDVLASCALPVPEDASHPPWLSDDALWFAGLYLAEGSMSGDTIQLSGHVNEHGRWQRVQRLCSFYGASARVYEDGNKQAIHIDRATALIAILKITVAGRTAKDKRLNPNVWTWGNVALRCIIEGYLEGDGSDDGKRVRLGFTRNYQLERDLRCAAARLNATITLKTALATIGTKTYPAFRGEWRWERSGHHNERDRAEVMEVRRSRARKFYDVSVADEPNLFALASGVLTHNSNPMPESVTDRPTSAHEKLFLLSRSARYFYDPEAVRVPVTGNAHARRSDGARLPAKGTEKGDGRTGSWQESYVPSSANLRNVWTIPTHGYSEAHFATFPPALVEPCIKAGTSEKGACAECGAPWRRVVDRRYQGGSRIDRTLEAGATRNRLGGQKEWDAYEGATTTGWSPSCECEAAVAPCVVLDPFGGSGTVGLVADRLQRDAVLIEISPEYAEMARRRIEGDAPLLAVTTG